MKRGLLVLFALALTGGILACDVLGGPVQGSGRVVKGEVPVSGFSGVTLAVEGTLYVEVGETEELRIEVDDNLVSYYDVDVDSKMLTIKMREGATIQPTKPVNFYLTVEELDTIVLSGSGVIKVESDLVADQFSIDLSGSGDVEIEGLRAGELEATLSGSGTLEIKGGQVTEQAIVLSGSGEYDAEEMQSSKAEVDLSGSGTVTIWVTSELAVQNSGSGAVRYNGTPQMRIEGGGSVVVEPLSE